MEGTFVPLRTLKGRKPWVSLREGKVFLRDVKAKDPSHMPTHTPTYNAHGTYILPTARYHDLVDVPSHLLLPVTPIAHFGSDLASESSDNIEASGGRREPSEQHWVQSNIFPQACPKDQRGRFPLGWF